MDERVLVWAGGRDGPLTCGVLADAGFGGRAVGSADELAREAAVGAGAVVVAAELLTPDTLAYLGDVLGRQPPWSDLPVVVVARGSAECGPGEPFAALGNVTVLPRPLAPDTLASTVRAALRARRRQYQVRGLLAHREEEARRKDEFIAVLAHELRNPLAPVRNALEILRLRGDDPTVVARARDMMDRQIELMARLIEDLLDLSRVGRGKLPLYPDRVDLRRVVREAVETASPLIEAAGHELTVDLPAGPLTVDGDPARLSQVFANLLTNAAKYTPDRGRICVSAVGEDGRAEVRVRDTGIGLPADLRPRLFEPFAQADGIADRAKGGLGLGLALVKGLVELHGGTIEAHSDGPGTGSEFVVRLPAAGPGPPPRPPVLKRGE